MFIAQNGKTELTFFKPKYLKDLNAVGKSSGSTVVSPMPGICDKVLVQVGDQVTAGTPVAVIIAMKMEYVLRAPRDGVVKLIGAQVGKNMAKGDVVCAFHDEEEAVADGK